LLPAKVENNSKIPYDQTFSLDEGKAWLALDSKLNYQIIFRDQDNNLQNSP